MPRTVCRALLSKHDQQVINSIFNPLAINKDEEDFSIIDQEEELQTPELRISKELEIQGVQLAESRDLIESIAVLGQAIAVAPQCASVYNNRAQALRLIGRDDDALLDLNQAILLSTQKLRTKCNALCQRGILNRKRENLTAARTDFEEAANLGSSFAKKQLIETNPYAALCNKMLKKAFDKNMHI